MNRISGCLVVSRVFTLVQLSAGVHVEGFGFDPSGPPEHELKLKKNLHDFYELLQLSSANANQTKLEVVQVFSISALSQFFFYC